MKPLAVVTPWFGAGLRGGAEQQARQIALRLAARGHAVEVLTTCARSFHDDWSTDFHPPGASNEDGLLVRRFRCDGRDPAEFDRANARLLALDPRALKVGVNPVGDDDARDFVRHNINSSALVRHLDAERDGYRAFLFLPYLYGTTLAGLPAVADCALLQPCLHDEPYARLPAVEEIFRRARRVLFNSEGERELALRLYGPGLHGRAAVVGEGVETDITNDETAAAGKEADAAGGDATRAEGVDALPPELRGARFVLYLGRRDATKNTHLLIRAFRLFRREHPDADLRLALAGEGEAVVSSRAASRGVFDLGVVSGGTKRALLVGALALFQPSRNESFSRAMMEAWLAGRPVAAHAECLATARAVERSRGGWVAATEEEWAELFARVADASDEELNELGRRGRAYAAEHADWDRVIDRYEQVLASLDEETAGQTSPPRAAQTRAGLRAVHQLLPDFVFGDAISQQAVAVRDLLRGLGFASEIFVKRREAGLAGEARSVDEEEIESDAGLVYHHSIGSEVTALAVAHRGPKCLVYHNVTPHEFFAPYRPGFAWLLEAGRASLARLARHFPCSAGVSPFNAAELSSFGFRDTVLLPNIVSPDKWNVEADRALIERLQDGATNLLFVGRVAPNKRQDKLVRVFAEYASLDPDSRLVVAGEGHEFDPYLRHVRREIARLGLSDRVLITGRVAGAALLACYRAAHLYLSASEHEGFGVPLVEAMWFDVPVLAARAGAVADTVGDAALLFDAETDLREVARLAKLLARDDEKLRRRLVEAGRLRRESFTPCAVRPAVESLARRMELAARGEWHETTSPSDGRRAQIA
jgi:glycosyltransferase involved in cell wall biosynthesis